MDRAYVVQRGGRFFGECLLASLALSACNVQDVYLLPSVRESRMLEAGAHDAAARDADTRDAGAQDSGTKDASEQDSARPPVIDAGSICVDATTKAPLGIYIMMDRSGSMGIIDSGSADTRWAIAVSAVSTFVESPAAAGLEAGIQFFALRDMSAFPFTSDCRPATYATPAVAIDILPDNASSIEVSLRSQGADTPNSLLDESFQLETPTNVALEGAAQSVVTWKAEHAGSEGVVLLVTDGQPRSQACNSSIPTTVTAAEQAVTAGVSTFVLGVGPDLTDLDTLAAAGGTERAYVIDAGGVDDLIAALDAFRTTSSPCGSSN